MSTIGNKPKERETKVEEEGVWGKVRSPDLWSAWWAVVPDHLSHMALAPAEPRGVAAGDSHLFVPAVYRKSGLLLPPPVRDSHGRPGVQMGRPRLSRRTKVETPVLVPSW